MITSQNYIIISQYYTMISQYYMMITILHDHITILHDHITIFHGHITVLHCHITILHSHVIISCHEIMRHRPKSKPKGAKRPFKPPRGNGKPSEGKHSAPSSKSAHKISKKNVIPGRKRALMEDNGKSLGAKLRMLPSYTFYKRNLQTRTIRKFVFLRFCRTFEQT